MQSEFIDLKCKFHMNKSTKCEKNEHKKKWKKKRGEDRRNNAKRFHKFSHNTLRSSIIDCPNGARRFASWVGGRGEEEVGVRCLMPDRVCIVFT